MEGLGGPRSSAGYLIGRLCGRGNESLAVRRTVGAPRSACLRMLLRFLSITTTALLGLFLLDRFVLNPRAITAVGMVIVTALAGSAILSAVSLMALRTRRAELVTNLWLVLFSSFIAYIAVDVIGGLVLITSAEPAIVRDSRVHHRLEPRRASRIETTEFEYVQDVNALGLRGPPVSRDKPAGTFRVLMLGDSFTMGKGVADHETFSALLGVELNRQAAGGRSDVEVLNGGVDSYTPVLSWLQLQMIGPVVSPDLVVLNLDMSDLLQEQTYRALAVRGPDGRINAVPAPERYDNWATHLAGFIDHHLLVTRWFRARFRSLDASPDGLTVEETVIRPSFELLRHTLANDDSDRATQWEDLFESILAVKQYADERGWGFVLTTYPWGHQVNDSEWLEGRGRFIPPNAVVSDASLDRIARFAESHGVAFVDMFPAFRAYQDPRPLYHSFDMHWTPAGHRLVAGQLEPSIEQAISAWRLRRTSGTGR